MPTGTNAQGDTARKNALQVIHTARFKINWNDAGIATGVQTGIWVPAGALFLPSYMWVTTAFNATSTNVLSVGTEATTITNLITTTQAVAGTAGLKAALAGTGVALAPLASDMQISYLYTQTGTAATAGAAYVVIPFVLDNDRNVGQ